MFEIIAVLIIGMVMGFAAQRSRFCIQGAFRDLFLIKDTHLMDGVLAAMLVFMLVNLIGYSHTP